MDVRARPLQILTDGAVAVTLFGALVLVYSCDRRTPMTSAAPEVTPPPELEEEPPPPLPEIPLLKDNRPPIDPVPRLKLQFNEENRFGLSTTTGNPDDPSDDNKKLTFSETGSTNNTRIWVDGQSPLFWSTTGRVVSPNRPAGPGRFECVWEYRGLEVLQRVEEVAGDTSRRMDAVRVTCVLTNITLKDCTAGLRVMLDSYIGDNDGVPFIVPGSEGIVTSPVSYRGDKVPDFVRALEKPDLVNPGVIVDIGLRPGEGERPSEVILTHWPGSNAEWDYDRTNPFGSDSAVGLYYEPRPLKPRQTRTISFTYGLGTISSTQTKNARLSLTAGGPFRAGGSFWLVALVQNPKAGQTVRLALPQGLSLTHNEQPVKPVVTDTAYSQLSWLVHAAPECLGNAEIKATLEPDGIQERQTILVEPPSSRLTLIAKSPVQAGKSFWAVALIRHPQASQEVTLTLPSGVSFASGESEKKPVPAGGDYAQVKWLLRAGSLPLENVSLQIRLAPGDAQASCSVDIQPGSIIH